MRPNKAPTLSLLLCIAAGAVIAALTITRPEPAPWSPVVCDVVSPGLCVELVPLSAVEWGWTVDT